MGIETIVAIATIAAATATVGTTIAGAVSGGPDPPVLPTPPPIPEPGKEGFSQQAQSLKRRRGRASTILTGPAAFGPVAASQSTKQLLGL